MICCYVKEYNQECNVNKKDSQVHLPLTSGMSRRQVISTFGALSLTGAALSQLDSPAALAAAALPAVDNVSRDNQAGWRWCNKCQGLFFAGSATQGVCPAWGAHDSTGSGNYQLEANVPAAPGQHNWRWCHKCQGLFFASHPFQGRCPAGDAHANVGSGNYILMSFSPGGAGQHNWRWCNKCEGLFFAGGFNLGICPAWDAHDLSGSGDYALLFV
jgi:hypothetical protein